MSEPEPYKEVTYKITVGVPQELWDRVHSSDDDVAEVAYEELEDIVLNDIRGQYLEPTSVFPMDLT